MLSRRDLLAGASAIAATSAFDTPVFAKAPMQNTLAPSFYRFKVGTIEATVISDGPLAIGAPSPELFKGVSADDFRKTLRENFLPEDNVLLEQNTLVINTGDRVVLFDTGMGSSKIFGDKAGRQLANLKAAGIEAKDVDAVVLTHGHPDHCWGLLSEGGQPNFPNAQVYINEIDFKFFTDEANAQGDMMKAIIAGCRKNLLGVKDRMVMIKEGQEILPGVQAISAPGHTGGHMMFMIASGGQTLCNIADISHHHIVSLAKPTAPFMFDGDAQQGIATRVKMLDMLTSQRTQVVAYHFPFPGVGFIAKQADAFRYFPSPMQTAP